MAPRGRDTDYRQHRHNEIKVTSSIFLSMSNCYTGIDIKKMKVSW